jgi:hypothetical protein
MPHWLEYRCIAIRHGMMVVGPVADPWELERRMWALLREELQHVDRAVMVPKRRLGEFGMLHLTVEHVHGGPPLAEARLYALLVDVEG